ncbi:hypothetical protein LHJ74_18590 [Streptomyces sp. N2-109]|uniref:Uncharacterized protein n=1 Tax=Streptomyces gossypii TaxID=2883101 RepID=A0ABT2JVF0_9ACTN|nr:hypothetical protein [Streptomyces gossypii]MCT2591882.1 hypothetical protein [Streptomyces gossypii]
MIDLINTTKLTGHSVIASCLPSVRLHSAGVSGVVLVGGNERLGGDERPIKAPAAAVAQAQSYVSAFAANGAGEGSQKTQQHSMWAFRGHDPWRDPA